VARGRFRFTGRRSRHWRALSLYGAQESSHPHPQCQCTGRRSRRSPPCLRSAHLHRTACNISKHNSQQLPRRCVLPGAALVLSIYLSFFLSFWFPSCVCGPGSRVVACVAVLLLHCEPQKHMVGADRMSIFVYRASAYKESRVGAGGYCNGETSHDDCPDDGNGLVLVLVLHAPTPAVEGRRPIYIYMLEMRGHLPACSNVPVRSPK
jgi:hypothetical protein